MFQNSKVWCSSSESLSGTLKNVLSSCRLRSWGLPAHNGSSVKSICQSAKGLPLFTVHSFGLSYNGDSLAGQRRMQIKVASSSVKTSSSYRLITVKILLTVCLRS